jgi:hypothetical protein
MYIKKFMGLKKLQDLLVYLNGRIVGITRQILMAGYSGIIDIVRGVE